MEKNVRVVDAAGIEYEATYPKRAKGLVKNGRARFLDEHTICLACPPDQMNLEDKTMSEQIVPEKLSMNYILEQIEKITNQTDYIYSVIEKLEQVQSKGPGDVAGEAQAHALGSVVAAREATNQKLIEFYHDLIDVL